MASGDPDFETKAADVIRLYLTPPPWLAAVICVDEKTESKHWTAWIQYFHYPQADWNGTAINQVSRFISLWITCPRPKPNE
jgi:hypothetical protein